MKKVSVLVAILFVLPTLAWAQSAVEIFIFSVEGDIMISRNKIIISCKLTNR